LYVKDAARAGLEIMQQVNGPCNMGSGDIYSIRQIVNALVKITHMENAVEWDSTKPNGQDYRSYDLSRLKATGFEKKWSIEQGLQETWDWYCCNADKN
jgi:GDP-L-fucose synthase